MVNKACIHDKTASESADEYELVEDGKRQIRMMREKEAAEQMAILNEEKRLKDENDKKEAALKAEKANKERADSEAKEKADKLAKEKADKDAKERADLDAKQRAEKEAKE